MVTLLSRLLEVSGNFGIIYFPLMFPSGIPIKSSLSTGLTLQYAHLATAFMTEVLSSNICTNATIFTRQLQWLRGLKLVMNLHA